jgi:hypothetical protein
MKRIAEIVNRKYVRLMIGLALVALAANALRRLVPAAFAQVPHTVVPYTTF